jgi:excisionase family DNA binding protein
MSKQAYVEPARAALTVKEAIFAMNICRAKFYNEVKAGRIKIVKAGTKTLIPASEPAKWLERIAAL